MDKNSIKESLDYIAVTNIYKLIESMLPKSGMLVEDVNSIEEELITPNNLKRTMGRVAIVTRIRNGTVQLNKKVDIMGSGYKLTTGGTVVKMSPREIIVRKQAAKKAARKRQIEMQSIIRKRMMSIRIRNSRIG